MTASDFSRIWKPLFQNSARTYPTPAENAPRLSFGKYQNTTGPPSMRVCAPTPKSKGLISTASMASSQSACCQRSLNLAEEPYHATVTDGVTRHQARISFKDGASNRPGILRNGCDLICHSGMVWLV